MSRKKAGLECTAGDRERDFDSKDPSNVELGALNLELGAQVGDATTLIQQQEAEHEKERPLFDPTQQL